MAFVLIAVAWTDEMKPIFDVRRLARESAGHSISIVLLAPPELREEGCADLLKSFGEVCASYGMDVTPDDVHYYAALIADRLKWAGTLDAGSTLH